MNFTTREITLTALFAAMAVVAAMLVRFGSAIVPFSLLPFVVLLAGGILGSRLGALSMALYVLMGLVGLPVFAKPPFGGPMYVLSPTFGFLLGFIAAAWVTGILLSKKENHSYLRYVLASLIGLVVIYLCGLPYLYIIMNFYLGQSMDVMKVLQVGLLPFIVPDLFKALAAAVLAKQVRQRLASTASLATADSLEQK
ncbi:MAG: biotin transporter BioY [Bacillota bacterium]